MDGSGQVRRPVCVYVYSEHTYISFRESEAKKKGSDVKIVINEVNVNTLLP